MVHKVGNWSCNLVIFGFQPEHGYIVSLNNLLLLSPSCQWVMMIGGREGLMLLCQFPFVADLSGLTPCGLRA